MKGENISMRLLKFAAQILRESKRLPGDPAGRHVLRQLVRAATGGGSNYEEARGAESRADFIHKTAIAAKEVREALYWLRLIEEAEMLDGSLSQLIREADELVAILTSSVNTARSRQQTSEPVQRQSTRRPDAPEPGSCPPSAPIG
jgi:four helix bundle protein